MNSSFHYGVVVFFVLLVLPSEFPQTTYAYNSSSNLKHLFALIIFTVMV